MKTKEFLAGSAFALSLAIVHPLSAQDFTEMTGTNFQTIYNNTSTAWGDYDNDGDLDVMILADNYGRIFRNNGNNTFTDMTSVPYSSNTKGTWWDYNNDGYIDIFISTYYNCYFIVKNNGNGTFTTQSDMIISGMQDNSVAIGDYNNDGYMDVMLTGNFNGVRKSNLYRNNGNGSFTNQTSISFAGVTNGCAAWADYDKDGNTDLLLTGYTGSTRISKIYKNNGDGTFTDQTVITMTGIQGSASWADYNNDGYPDILLTGYTGSSPNYISKIYKNNGDGTFTDQTSITMTGIQGCASWADYNNDGNADVFITGYTGTSYVSKLYKNNGDNTFAEQTSLSLLSGQYSYASWGDFDNDNDLDLLVSCYNSPPKLYRNNCVTANLPPSAPTGLGSAVTDDDASLSWTAGTDDHSPSASLTYNLRIGKTTNGIEQLSPLSNTSTGFRKVVSIGNDFFNTNYTIKNLKNGSYYYSVQAVDAAYQGGSFTAEGTFTVSYSGSPSVQAYKLQSSNIQQNQFSMNWTDGSGDYRAVFIKEASAGTANPLDNETYVPNTVFGLGGQIGSTGWFCVWNGNAAHGSGITITGLNTAQDYMVMVCEYNGGPGSEKYNTLVAEGNPMPVSLIFIEQTGISLPGTYNSNAQWGDYDNDNDLDLMINGNSGTQIYRNNANNTFTNAGFSFQTAEYKGTAFGDYDNDGDLDLLVSGSSPTRLYRNNGNNTFTEQTSHSMNYVRNGHACWGDYNNDGLLDVVLSGSGASSNDFTRIYKNNGDNTFSWLSAASFPGFSYGYNAWADFDNDGNLDLLLSGNGLTRIYKNNGDGTFTYQSTTTFTSYYNSRCDLGDYNNDGRLDIIITGSYGSSGHPAKIYRNEGAFVFTEITGLSIPAIQNSMVAWGDYDNDGLLDFLLSGYIYDENNIGQYVTKMFHNDGGSLFTEHSGMAFTGVAQGSISWGDYDNDGDPDIVITGYGKTGSISRIFKNYLATGNAAPSAASNLSAAPSGDDVSLSWDKSTDDHTPQNGLNYNIRIGTTSLGTEKMAAMANASSGYRRVARLGNAVQNNSWTLKNLANGSYYWSVQAIDGNYLGGSFATEGTFSISYNGSPTVQAFNLKISAVQQNQFTLNWSDGNGDKRAVFVKEAATGTALPVNNETYAPDPVFGNGGQIGTSGWYCVWNSNAGHTTGITITNLSTGKDYIAMVCEYNGAAGSENYNSNTALNNPAMVSLLFIEQSSISIPGTSYGNVAISDYDNDEDMDILLTGSSAAGLISRIYRNNNDNTFTYQSGISITGVSNGSVAWGDYNNDNKLDILLTGSSGGGYISRIYKNNGDNTFTNQTAITLTGVYNSGSAWGDYDNDGWLDIVLSGYGGGYISKIYHNNGNNTFTEQTGINLTGMQYSSVAWGDYDNDNDLDIIQTGGPSSGLITKIYRNNGNNTFADQTAISLHGVYMGSARWGDYDNDGDLDIALTGIGNPQPYYYTKIYCNNGNNTFTEQTGISLAGAYNSQVFWGDYDNDGNLDLLLSGYFYENNEFIRPVTKIYHNNGDNTFTEKVGLQFLELRERTISWIDFDNDGDLDIFQSGYSLAGSFEARMFKNLTSENNIPPQSPAGLSVAVNNSNVTLNWAKSTDDHTLQNGLNYNIRVGKTSGGIEIASPMAHLNDGYRKIVELGNTCENNSWTIKHLPNGTYYWAVQAIDGEYKGSGFSDEGTFTVAYTGIPDIQAFQLTISGILTTQFNLNWADGNGDQRAVFVKEGNSGTASPVNDQTYNPDLVLGQGSQIGASGWYCVWNGNNDHSTGITITNLLADKDYIAMICEYNGTAGNEQYQTNTAEKNPAGLHTNLFLEQSGISLSQVYYSSCAWGDYDNDDDLDILLTGYSAGGISKLYKNNGDNTFTEQTGISLPGVYQSSIAWGDYDNDGDLDILLTGYYSGGSISRIYRNNGNNSFTYQSGISLTGVYIGSCAWGDYNNDGYLDILLTGYASGAISRIYKNNGDNTFTEQSGISLTGVYYSSIALGDYDIDGDPDILLTGYTGSTYISKIYRNNGDNTFTEQTGISLAGLYRGSVAWGDYDNDGDLDIFLSGYTGSTRVSKIYRNNGDNTFTEQTSISLTGVDYSSAAWGDYDNDGDLDILLNGQSSGVNVSKIYKNNGDNTFTDQTGISLPGIYCSSVVWGDYDKDADLDILLSGYTGSTAVSKIFRNDIAVPNDPPEAPANAYATLNGADITFHWDKVTSDETPADGLNYNIYLQELGQSNYKYSPHANPANGFRRIAAIGQIQWQSSSFTLKGIIESGKAYKWSVQAVDAGLRGGAFAPVQEIPQFTEQTGISLPGIRSGSVAWGDYDNDGDLDIFLCGSSGGSGISEIYKNNGDNTFTEQTGILITGVFYGDAAWGDYDNDGDLDIILTGYTGSEGISKIYKNNNDNTFSEQTGIILTGVYNSSVDWGDCDNDGYLDVILTGFSGTSHVSKIYKNNGDNTFSEQSGISLPGVEYGNSKWSDYDADGDLDILLIGSSVSGYISRIYKNNGNFSFTEQTSVLLTGVYNGSVAWGDYDSDGDPDILMTGSTSGSSISKIYKNNGDNSFTEQTGISLPNVNFSDGIWGDYDNDGDLDIIISGAMVSGRLSKIFNNNGDNTFSEQTETSLTGVSTGSVAWGDYDNDGDLDILLSGWDGSSETTIIYRNNNLTANTVPLAPGGLNATVSGSDVTFNWLKSTDAETPQNGLSYNLYVGTSPGGVQKEAPMSNTINGYRRIVHMGNMNEVTSYTLKGLPPATYYWSIQAVDHAFAGGPFATEGTFNVPCPPACSNYTRNIASCLTSYTAQGTEFDATKPGNCPAFTLTHNYAGGGTSLAGKTFPAGTTTVTWTTDDGTGNTATCSSQITVTPLPPPVIYPTSGLLGLWPFSGNANDVSGNNHHGTVNGATLTADRFGNPNSAYSFDGTDDNINCGSFVPAASVKTIACWAYLNNLNNADLVSKANLGTGIELLELSGYLRINLPPGSNVMTTVSASQWFHIVGMVNPIGGGQYQMSLYINGNLEASEVKNVGTVNDGTYLYFGAWGDLSSRFLNGKLDEIAIYDRVLTNPEILALYNGSAPVTAPTVQATQVSFSNIQTNQMTVNWTDGNGEKRAVFIKQTDNGTPLPQDYQYYAPSTLYGEGDQISNSGWYCIWNGNGDHSAGVTVTGLIPVAAVFRVMVCEYNGVQCGEKYNKTAATNNPNNQATLSELSPPVSASSDRSGFCADDAGNIQLTATGGNGTTLAWYTGSCGGTPTGTGTPLILPSPATTTTYYVRWESTGGNTTCASVTVNVYPTPTATAEGTDPSCYGGTDGKVKVTASGGTDPYEFSKDNGVSFTAGSNPYTFTGLSAGVLYKIMVRDVNGCASPLSP